jgi:hypothetical protein
VIATGVTKFSTWAIANPSDQPLAVRQANERVPANFELAQNFPNPFLSGAKSPALGGRNPETVIEYQLPRASEVEISIFNLQGQKVATLVKGHQTAGAHKIIWNGTEESGQRVASGVYLYQLKAADPASGGAGKFVQVKRMLLLR